MKGGLSKRPRIPNRAVQNERIVHAASIVEYQQLPDGVKYTNSTEYPWREKPRLRSGSQKC